MLAQPIPKINKVEGAVILHEEKTLEEAIALLSGRVGSLINYTYFNHPNELINLGLYDMLVVGSLQDLRGVIRCYEGREAPLFIHLADKQEYGKTDYASEFPTSEVLAIRQNTVDMDPEVTLQFSKYEETITRLFSKKQQKRV